MLKTNITSALRTFGRFKIFSSINLLGLVLGLLSVLFLVTYASFELSFDKFHKNKNTIFRVNDVTKNPRSIDNSPILRVIAGPEIYSHFPEVIAFNRFRKLSSSVTYGESTISVSTLYADPNFFSFFTFPLVVGSEATALLYKNSIVLTKNKARLLFGNQDPIGKIVSIKGQNYSVTAIADDPPKNSHIQFDAVLPLENLINQPDIYIGWDGGLSTFTFIQLQNEVDAEELTAKFEDFLWERINKKNEGTGFFTSYYLEPITRVHLFSEVDWDHFNKSDLTYVLSMLGIALLILLTGCINYILITTGIMSLRLKEFNIKKSLGAGKRYLFNQIIIESVLFFITALSISIVIMYMLSPKIQQFIGYDFNIIEVQFPGLVGYFMLLAGILILVISKIIHWQIVNKVQGITSKIIASQTKKKSSLSLIAGLQFFIAIVLITSLIFVYKQLSYALNKDLGFTKENIVFIINGSIAQKKEVLIQEFGKVNGVKEISASFGLPGLESTRNGYRPQGLNEWLMFNAIYVDDNFFETYGIKLAEGRTFFQGDNTDKDVYIINQTLARQLNWDEPIGKTIYRDGNHEVIGVVEDFHLASIYEKIPPLIISKELSSDFYALSISIQPDDIQNTIANMKSIWEKVLPGEIFSFSFLDQSYQRLYEKVNKLSMLLFIFTLIAVTIALLGLFGITLLLINAYTKEIGIRKVNGAKTKEIMLMLNTEFIKWVVIAFFLSCPLSWLIVTRWLENFAYKTSLSWWVFALAGVIAMAIALLTVSFQSLKAATKNPVESLRYE